MSIYLPTYQPTKLSIYLPTYQPTNLPTYLLTILSIYLPIYLSTYQTMYLPTYQLPANLSLYLTVYLSTSCCSLPLSLYILILVVYFYWSFELFLFSLSRSQSTYFFSPLLFLHSIFVQVFVSSLRPFVCPDQKTITKGSYSSSFSSQVNLYQRSSKKFAQQRDAKTERGNHDSTKKHRGRTKWKM